MPLKFHAAAEMDQENTIRLSLQANLDERDPVLTVCGQLVPADQITTMQPQYNELMELPGRFCPKCFPIEPARDRAVPS